MRITRGSIYYAELGNGIGSEQKGTRPVLIIQNDMGNKHSPTVICAAITSKIGKAKLPTHVSISSEVIKGISKDSIVMLEQVRTIDKKRLKEYVGSLDLYKMMEIDKAMLVSFGLNG